MTSIFDGMAGLLSDMFGAPVLYRPQGGAPRSIQSIFREEPVELIDNDGHPVRSVGPTWRVRQDLVPEVRRGDLITVGSGRSFEVQAVGRTGSPASDAMVICDLFEVEA